MRTPWLPIAHRQRPTGSCGLLLGGSSLGVLLSCLTTVNSTPPSCMQDLLRHLPQAHYHAHVIYILPFPQRTFLHSPHLPPTCSPSDPCLSPSNTHPSERGTGHACIHWDYTMPGLWPRGALPLPCSLLPTLPGPEPHTCCSGLQPLTPPLPLHGEVDRCTTFFYAPSTSYLTCGASRGAPLPCTVCSATPALPTCSTYPPFRASRRCCHHRLRATYLRPSPHHLFGFLDLPTTRRCVPAWHRLVGSACR